MQFSFFFAGAILLLNTVYDLRRQEILPLPSALIALAGAAVRFSADPGELRYLPAALLPGLLLLLISRLTRGGIGGGDGLLLVFLGLLLPPLSILLLLFFALLFASLYAGILLLLHKKKRNDRFPFVPFLALAALCSLGGLL